MTLQELVTEVEDAVVPAPKRAEIVRRLNLAQDRISRELEFPTRYIEDVDASASFALPAEARPGSLRYAEWGDDTDDPMIEVPIYSVALANRYYPGWESSDFQNRIIIYDPANATAPVTPLGFDVGDLLRLEYVVKPTAMSDLAADEPFDGLLPQFHHMLSQYVIFEYLLRQSDQRASAFYADFQNLKKEAWLLTMPAPRPALVRKPYLQER